MNGQLISEAQKLFVQCTESPVFNAEFKSDYGEVINYVANVLACTYEDYMTIWDYFNKYFQRY